MIRGLEAYLRRRLILVGEFDEYVQSVPKQLHEISTYGNVLGDCDDAAVLLGALLSTVGVPVRLVAVRKPESSSYVHVFVEAFDGAEWLVVDPTATGPAFPGLERMVVDV